MQPENPLTPCQPVAVGTKKCPWSSSPSPRFEIFRDHFTFPFTTPMVQLDPLLTLGTNVSSLLTHSELLTSAPAGSSRRTGGTGEEKEEKEKEKVPALPAGSTVELVDLGLPERGTRSCAYAATLTIHASTLTIDNPRIHSRRAIVRHCPSQVRCRSNIEKDRITDGNTHSGLILAIMDDLGSLKKNSVTLDTMLSRLER